MPASDATGYPDDEALTALRNRDPEAVERWIYGQRDFIRSVLFRYTKDGDTAEDLIQETFLQALRSLPSFRGDSKITTWLYSIARNVALSRLRQTRRYNYLESETLEHVQATSEGELETNTEGPSPADDTVRSEEMRLLHDALDELSPSYREVVALRDLEELSTREVAEQLGLSRVNVRVRLHRARTALREQLQPRLDAAYQVAA
jgi:RNA polymerase sigma-70 factor (ECF subfamily)